ncbi:hypothetical protein PHISP_03395 [Aspergillus sp. HF37]|nr:hypothetical protein PHISP_03395 [Aspergillus sp. HF37]
MGFRRCQLALGCRRFQSDGQSESATGSLDTGQSLSVRGWEESKSELIQLTKEWTKAWKAESRKESKRELPEE